MATVTATVRTLPDTRAAVVRAGTHTLLADRPDGAAGGMGLGFNGAQLLAAAIGGYLANDVRVRVEVTAAGAVDTSRVVERALAISAVLASVREGFPVQIVDG